MEKMTNLILTSLFMNVNEFIFSISYKLKIMKFQPVDTYI